MIFVGVDWAEVHHDVCILDEGGDVLARKRIPDALAGVQQLHATIAEHLGEENDAEGVIVGIETERGLLVTALVAAGYQVYAVNPLAASRYRDETSYNVWGFIILAVVTRFFYHGHLPEESEALGAPTLTCQL